MAGWMLFPSSVSNSLNTFGSQSADQRNSERRQTRRGVHSLPLHRAAATVVHLQIEPFWLPRFLDTHVRRVGLCWSDTELSDLARLPEKSSPRLNLGWI